MIIEKYLPHRPPILLVDQVISHTKDSVMCRTDWEKKTFFHDDKGKLTLVAMVEMVAQSAALMYGLREEETGKPRLGMLTGIKKFELFSFPQKKEPVTIEVHTEGQLGNHQIVSGKVRQDHTILAEGMLFLYLEDAKNPGSQ